MIARLLFIVIFSFLVGPLSSDAQLIYNEYKEVIAFSYIDPKFEKLKKYDRLNTLQLPSYNNDSLFWESNICYLLPRRDRGKHTLGLTRAAGLIIDTTINFFDAATRVKIKQGYVWIYRIYSPTAMELSVHFSNCGIKTGDYLAAHSNFTDSINGPLQYRLPEVEVGPQIWYKEHSNGHGYGFNFIGNILYIEYFSPTKGELPIIDIQNVTYYYITYNTGYSLSDAPNWIRDRYPGVDFENGCYY